MAKNIEKIRVCFVMPKAYPLFNRSVDKVFGGSEVDLYYLSSELAKDSGFDVSFIVADYGQPPIQQIEGVRVIKSVDFSQNPLAGAIRLWRAMKTADADFYVLKTASMGTFLTALFCRLNRREFIYRSAHTTHCDGSWIKAHPLGGKLFAWAVRSAEMSFVQNESDKSLLERSLGVSSIMLPNGHRLQKKEACLRDSILWVGRSAAFKRPFAFLDLARSFSDQRFVMICQRATGDDNYQSILEQAEAIENLEFHRRVDFHQIDEYFKRARVLVNTSDSEGFPNVFIQACKASTPILSLNVNPDGFLDQYGCGVCCDGDMGKMTEQLARIISTDAGVEMGSCGRGYVEQVHDIAKIIEEYKKIFNDLIDQRGGR
jgi:glycosyltransferase involved in cell wall biosynthesis